MTGLAYGFISIAVVGFVLLVWSVVGEARR